MRVVEDLTHLVVAVTARVLVVLRGLGVGVIPLPAVAVDQAPLTGLPTRIPAVSVVLVRMLIGMLILSQQIEDRPWADLSRRFLAHSPRRIWNKSSRLSLRWPVWTYPGRGPGPRVQTAHRSSEDPCGPLPMGTGDRDRWDLLGVHRKHIIPKIFPINGAGLRPQDPDLGLKDLVTKKRTSGPLPGA
jgi:hypothetical protein